MTLFQSQDELVYLYKHATSLQKVRLTEIGLLHQDWPTYLGCVIPVPPLSSTEYVDAERQISIRGPASEINHEYMVVFRDPSRKMILLDGYECLEFYLQRVKKGLMSPELHVWVLQVNTDLSTSQIYQLAFYISLTRVNFREDRETRSLPMYLKALRIVMLESGLVRPGEFENETLDNETLMTYTKRFVRLVGEQMRDVFLTKLITVSGALPVCKCFSDFLEQYEPDLAFYNELTEQGSLFHGVLSKCLFVFVYDEWYWELSPSLQMLLTLVLMSIGKTSVEIGNTTELKKSIIKLLSAAIRVVSLTCTRLKPLSVEHILLSRMKDPQTPSRSFERCTNLHETILFALAFRITPLINEALEPLYRGYRFDFLLRDYVFCIPPGASLRNQDYDELLENCLSEVKSVLLLSGLLKQSKTCRFIECNV